MPLLFPGGRKGEPARTVRPPPPPGHGPGTELKALLARLVIVASQGCACNSMAAKMDRYGPQWCREHIEEIVDVMEREAARRKAGGKRSRLPLLLRLPFWRTIARNRVLVAIARSVELQ